ncbi:hypothetical protein BD560DRAFT_392028 [Blakeslea trispora]|nr:hypothetical protein BD560DRAFT_392028 [Blakeslea trispora]
MSLFKQTMDYQTISFNKKPYNRVYVDHIKDGSKNSTWSGAYTNKQSPKSHRLNVTEIESAFFMLSSPIEERISIYEERYKKCMESPTQLSNWIKNVKQKGPPSPLIEGREKMMLNCQLPAKSKFSEILFSSVSTKSRSRHCSVQEATETTPTVRSSISTFLKKATRSLSTSYKQAPTSKQQKSIELAPLPSASYQKRFSFNRFSLTSKAKQQKGNALCQNSQTHPIPTGLKGHKKSSIRINPEGSISRAYGTTKKLSSKILGKKPIPSFEEECHETSNKLIRNKSIDSGIKMSDSSSFLSLEKPNSKQTEYADERQCQTIQSNLPPAPLLVSQNTYLYTDTTHDDSTPHLASSPSIDSVHLIVPPSHSSSIPPRCTLTGPKVNPVIASEESIFMKKARKQQEATAYSNCNKHQDKKKKNRASLLATSSLSTIRILSQKSQLLKR